MSPCGNHRVKISPDEFNDELVVDTLMESLELNFRPKSLYYIDDDGYKNGVSLKNRFETG